MKDCGCLGRRGIVGLSEDDEIRLILPLAEKCDCQCGECECCAALRWEVFLYTNDDGTYQTCEHLHRKFVEAQECACWFAGAPNYRARQSEGDRARRFDVIYIDITRGPLRGPIRG
jgi:hypothetical protein